MGKHLKPDMATLIQRLIDTASLPASKQKQVNRLSRHQILELIHYFEELKKTNAELNDKIDQMTEENKEQGIGEDDTERP